MLSQAEAAEPLVGGEQRARATRALYHALADVSGKHRTPAAPPAVRRGACVALGLVARSAPLALAAGDMASLAQPEGEPEGEDTAAAAAEGASGATPKVEGDASPPAGGAEAAAEEAEVTVTKAAVLQALAAAMMSTKSGKGASSSSRLLEEAARAVGMLCVGERDASLAAACTAVLLRTAVAPALQGGKAAGAAEAACAAHLAVGHALVCAGAGHAPPTPGLGEARGTLQEADAADADAKHEKEELEREEAEAAAAAADAAEEAEAEAAEAAGAGGAAAAEEWELCEHDCLQAILEQTLERCGMADKPRHRIAGAVWLFCLLRSAPRHPRVQAARLRLLLISYQFHHMCFDASRVSS